VATYANLSLLVIVFLITDYVRHKPVIVADAIFGVAIYALLIWAQGVPAMQVNFMSLFFQSKTVLAGSFEVARNSKFICHS